MCGVASSQDLKVGGGVICGRVFLAIGVVWGGCLDCLGGFVHLQNIFWIFLCGNDGLWCSILSVCRKYNIKFMLYIMDT